MVQEWRSLRLRAPGKLSPSEAQQVHGRAPLGGLQGLLLFMIGDLGYAIKEGLT